MLAGRFVLLCSSWKALALMHSAGVHSHSRLAPVPYLCPEATGGQLGCTPKGSAEGSLVSSGIRATGMSSEEASRTRFAKLTCTRMPQQAQAHGHQSQSGSRAPRDQAAAQGRQTGRQTVSRSPRRGSASRDSPMDGLHAQPDPRVENDARGNAT